MEDIYSRKLPPAQIIASQKSIPNVAQNVYPKSSGQANTTSQRIQAQANSRTASNNNNQFKYHFKHTAIRKADLPAASHSSCTIRNNKLIIINKTSSLRLILSKASAEATSKNEVGTRIHQTNLNYQCKL